MNWGVMWYIDFADWSIISPCIEARVRQQSQNGVQDFKISLRFQDFLGFQDFTEIS